MKILNDSAQVLTVTEREALNIEINKADKLQLIGESSYYIRYETTKDDQLTLLCCRREKSCFLYLHGRRKRLRNGCIRAL